MELDRRIRQNRTVRARLDGTGHMVRRKMKLDRWIRQGRTESERIDGTGYVSTRQDEIGPRD